MAQSARNGDRYSALSSKGEATRGRIRAGSSTTVDRRRAGKTLLLDSRGICKGAPKIPHLSAHSHGASAHRACWYYLAAVRAGRALGPSTVPRTVPSRGAQGDSAAIGDAARIVRCPGSSIMADRVFKAAGCDDCVSVVSVNCVVIADRVEASIDEDWCCACRRAVQVFGSARDLGRGLSRGYRTFGQVVMSLKQRWGWGASATVGVCRGAYSRDLDGATFRPLSGDESC